MNTLFDKVTVDLVRKFKDERKLTTVGLEGTFNLHNNTLSNVQAVAQVQNSAREVVKVGVNNELNINLLVKKPFTWFDNFATVSVGAAVNGIANKAPQLKTGLEVGLNL